MVEERRPVLGTKGQRHCHAEEPLGVCHSSELCKDKDVL